MKHFVGDVIWTRYLPTCIFLAWLMTSLRKLAFFCLTRWAASCHQYSGGPLAAGMATYMVFRKLSSGPAHQEIVVCTALATTPRYRVRLIKKDPEFDSKAKNLPVDGWVFRALTFRLSVVFFPEKSFLRISSQNSSLLLFLVSQLFFVRRDSNP